MSLGGLASAKIFLRFLVVVAVVECDIADLARSLCCESRRKDGEGTIVLQRGRLEDEVK